jgi:alanine racemase
MPAPFGGRGSWLAIDLSAIRHNLRRVRGMVGPATRLFAVVKANAYGHGAVPVARAAREAGADALAVATLSEAEELRAAGIGGRVIVLGGLPTDAVESISDLDLEVVVGSLELLAALSRWGERSGRRVPVHLKFDTGMGRIGFEPSDATVAAERARSSPGVRLVGLCSHFATAEWSDARPARRQQERMRALCGAIEPLKLAQPIERHLANSAAVLRWPECHLDAVRVGLLTYGLSPGGACDAEGFRPALSWLARPLYLRWGRRGDTVGYGRRHRLRRRSRLMVLPAGYADGYLRSLSNKAAALVRGQRAPVIGAVSMDSLVADVTGIDGVGLADEVVLIGRMGDDEITVSELADLADTVPHEVVSALGLRLPRRYLNEAGDPA